MASIFTDTTLYAGNKLGMINQCLISIGQRPLVEGTLVDQLPVDDDGRIAGDIISNVMKTVQNQGWFFNTDTNFTFTPDNMGFIAVPPSLLRIDVGNTYNRGKVFLRGNKFYNTITKDFIFTAPVIADAIWLVDYEILPYNAYQYIAARAAREFQQRVLPDAATTQISLKYEEDCFITLQIEDAQYTDNNMLDLNLLNRNINIR